MSFKIALLEPSSGVEGCYTHAGHNEFEPIGLEYIATALFKEGYTVKIFRQAALSFDAVVEMMKAFKPQVLGISVMTHAANSAIAISKLAKKQIAGLCVIAGGYHPSGYPEYILESSIDYVVIGEGERVVVELIDCIIKGGDLSTVNGIRYKEPNKIITTEPAKRIMDLESIPLPFRSKEFLQTNRMHTLMLPAPSRQKNLAVIMSSRGCPHGCSFCCSQSIWGRQVAFRKPESVVEEIKQLVDNFGTNALFLSDLTFNCNEKYVVELCEKLIEYGNTPPWYAMCTISNLNENIAQAMRAAGCRKIGFGIEALSESHLRRINKRSVTILEKINRVLEICDESGLLTKGYLIIGYPWETPMSLNEFKKSLPQVKVDEIRISYFTPFPGSSDFQQYQSQLSTNEWGKFNAIRNVVLRNDNGVSDEDLQSIRVDGFKQFYNDPEYKKRVIRKIDNFPEFKDSFDEFLRFLVTGKVLCEDEKFLESN